jgi:hypothetical protein
MMLFRRRDVVLSTYTIPNQKKEKRIVALSVAQSETDRTIPRVNAGRTSVTWCSECGNRLVSMPCGDTMQDKHRCPPKESIPLLQMRD